MNQMVPNHYQFVRMMEDMSPMEPAMTLDGVTVERGGQVILRDLSCVYSSRFGDGHRRTIWGWQEYPDQDPERAYESA